MRQLIVATIEMFPWAPRYMVPSWLRQSRMRPRRPTHAASDGTETLRQWERFAGKLKSVMMLAAISFSDPLMLAGLAAAAIPVVLHLLNRIRSPIVPFPTLRFLKITAQKTSRRRQVQQYLLLLVRMAVFALIAMAISRPLIRGGSAGLAYSFIVMFLAAMALFVMAGVWGSTAVDKSKTPLPDSQTVQATPPRPGTRAASGAGRYWGLSAITLLLAILLAGYSAFGLVSDKFFSGDKGEFSGRSTAAVIILDNSYSMLARQDAASRLQRAKEQVRQLLADAIKPVEAAILPTNPGSDTADNALTPDLTRLLGYVDKIEVTGRAHPMKERIRTAAQMLENSSQSSKMLIVVSDFARPAFADAEVFAPLKEFPGGKDFHVVLMPMSKGSPPADVGIEDFTVAESSGQPVVGSEITFEAQVLNNGDAADVKELVFAVDDKIVESVRPRVQLGPAGTGSARVTIKVPYRLTQAGPHRFTLRLADAQDAMEWDNQRQLMLDVSEQVRVLVVGPEDRPRPRSAAFYFDAALSPFDAGGGMTDAGGKPVAWSIRPTYRGVEQVGDYGALAGYAAVFMCDVPRISVPLADALSRYLKEGGRVVWVLGSSVDAAAYNQVLLGNGRELLPATLGEPLVSLTGSTVDWVDLQSPLFANLFDNQEPFRTVVVTGRWSFKGGALVRGRPLGKLADGSVLMAEHSAPGGGGEVYTIFTSPSAAWSNLGATVLLVPMASRMALGDSARFRAETSYDLGSTFLIHVPGADRGMAKVTLDVTTPTKAVVNARPVMSGEIPRWYFDKTQTDGVYYWRSSDGKHTGMFVVNPPGEEVDLLSADVESLARETGTNRPTIIAPSAAELLSQLEKRSAGTTLAPGVLAMVLMLAVIEALMANRYRPAAGSRETRTGGEPTASPTSSGQDREAA